MLLRDDLRMFLQERYSALGITPLEVERAIARLTSDNGAPLYEQNRKTRYSRISLNRPKTSRNTRTRPTTSRDSRLLNGQRPPSSPITHLRATVSNWQPSPMGDG